MLLQRYASNRTPSIRTPHSLWIFTCMKCVYVYAYTPTTHARAHTLTGGKHRAANWISEDNGRPALLQHESTYSLNFNDEPVGNIRLTWYTDKSPCNPWILLDMAVCHINAHNAHTCMYVWNITKKLHHFCHWSCNWLPHLRFCFFLYLQRWAF